MLLLDCIHPYFSPWLCAQKLFKGGGRLWTNKTQNTILGGCSSSQLLSSDHIHPCLWPLWLYLMWYAQWAAHAGNGLWCLMSPHLTIIPGASQQLVTRRGILRGDIAWPPVLTISQTRGNDGTKHVLGWSLIKSLKHIVFSGSMIYIFSIPGS